MESTSGVREKEHLQTVSGEGQKMSWGRWRDRERCITEDDGGEGGLPKGG